MKRPLLQTLRLLLISALAGAMWVAHRPEEVVVPAVEKSRESGDLIDDIRQAAIKRATVIEVSEAALNEHLASVLPGRLSSSLGDWIQMEGALVQLEDGHAHVVLIWNIRGFRRTASVDLALRREEGNFHVELLRGAFGHLRLPRGMMRPLYPALRVLAEALDPEIRALFQMTQITVARDKLVLDSRFTST
jgi:hypothetical protein